jgi:hypothetical protein
MPILITNKTIYFHYEFSFLWASKESNQQRTGEEKAAVHLASLGCVK